MNRDLSSFTADKALTAHIIHAGRHPVYEDGAQIALDFGWTLVSIAWTPFTQGVEMFAWGLFHRPILNLTPEVAVRVLKKIMERSS